MKELVDGIEAVRAGVDGVRATATSPDGLVTATVSGRGELVDLAVDPRAYRSPDSRALADSVPAAVEDPHRRVFAVLRPLLPARRSPAPTWTSTRS